MSKVTIEQDCQKYLQLVVQDGHRTTISLEHEDGLELLAQLKAYYEQEDLQADVVRRAAQAMLDNLISSEAERRIVQEIMGRAKQQEIPDGPTHEGKPGQGSKDGA